MNEKTGIASAGNRTRAACVASEHSTTELINFLDRNIGCSSKNEIGVNKT